MPRTPLFGRPRSHPGAVDAVLTWTRFGHRLSTSARNRIRGIGAFSSLMKFAGPDWTGHKLLRCELRASGHSFLRAKRRRTAELKCWVRLKSPGRLARCNDCRKRPRHVLLSNCHYDPEKRGAEKHLILPSHRSPPFWVRGMMAKLGDLGPSSNSEPALSSFRMPFHELFVSQPID